MSDTLPLAEASLRLRKRPGRPRTRPVEAGPPGPDNGHTVSHRPTGRRMTSERERSALVPQAPVLAPLTPRLLDTETGAAYCGVSPDTFMGWVRAGLVHRVPMPARVLRFDRYDLDALVERWKQATRG